MIKYYYTSITNRNLYMDDFNLLDYLDEYFPDIYTYYQENFIKSNIVGLGEHKNMRISFNKKVEEKAMSLT